MQNSDEINATAAGKICLCGLMPSPQPSPTGRGGKHNNGNVAVCCPHQSPLPRGEGVNTTTATLRYVAPTTVLSHGERGQIQQRQRCGMLPSPRPSPTGRGGKYNNGNVVLCCPHPGPLPRGEGVNTITATLRYAALTTFLSHGERGQIQKRQRCGMLPSPRSSPTKRRGKYNNGNVAVCCPHHSSLPRGEGANTTMATLRYVVLTPALSHGERGKD